MTDDQRPLDGLEKTMIAAGVGFVAIVLKSAHNLQKRRMDDNRFRWTDKNRWE